MHGDDIKIVFLDLEMPEKNGIETAIWIRDCEKLKHLKNVPIIGLTGHEEEEIKKACLDSGMNRVLSKPIKKEDILSALKEYTSP